MKNYGFQIAEALSDWPLNEDASYAGDAINIVLELIKSFDTSQLQNVHSNLDNLKIEIEKLILLRS